MQYTWSISVNAGHPNNDKPIETMVMRVGLKVDYGVGVSRSCTSSTRDFRLFPFTILLWLNLISSIFVVRRDLVFTLRVSYGFPVKPELDLLRKHAPETAEAQYMVRTS